MISQYKWLKPYYDKKLMQKLAQYLDKISDEDFDTSKFIDGIKFIRIQLYPILFTLSFLKEDILEYDQFIGYLYFCWRTSNDIHIDVKSFSSCFSANWKKVLNYDNLLLKELDYNLNFTKEDAECILLRIY